MSENASRPGGAGHTPGTAADPAAARPSTPSGGARPWPGSGKGESIVVPPEILKQQAGWGELPAQPVRTEAAEEPQVFASTVRKKDLSEAGYEEPPQAGRLGVILGTLLAVVLVASGVTLYLMTRSDGGTKSADAAATASPTPTHDPVPPIKADATVLPTVTGAFDTKATIALPKDGPADTFVVKPLIQGSGPKVAKNSWLTADYTALNWTTGKPMPGSFDQGKPQLFQAGTGTLIPALDEAVTGHPAGSRLLVVAPPAAAFGPQGNSAMGVGPKDTVVFVIDIRDAHAPNSVLGGAMTAPPAGMPTVKDNGSKPAGITPVPGVAAPTDLKSAVLIQGKGPKVESGEEVVVQYTGVLYKDGTKFDSSLDQGQAYHYVTGGGGVIDGWDKGIIGQNVGSRIELVIPPSLGYKDQAQGSIPANSTLVFVIDILAAGVGVGDS